MEIIMPTSLAQPGRLAHLTGETSQGNAGRTGRRKRRMRAAEARKAAGAVQEPLLAQQIVYGNGFASFRSYFTEMGTWRRDGATRTLETVRYPKRLSDILPKPRGNPFPKSLLKVVR